MSNKRISRPITISLQPDILEQLDQMSSNSGMNRSQYISTLIQNEIKKQSSVFNKVKHIFNK